MKKKVGTFKIWLLAIAAVVAFSVLPKVSSLATEDQALVPAENLVGIYRHRVAGLGSAAMFLQTTQGMILCVICPILLMVVCDTICRRRNERSEKKAADALRTELETLRAEKEKHI